MHEGKTINVSRTENGFAVQVDGRYHNADDLDEVKELSAQAFGLIANKYERIKVGNVERTRFDGSFDPFASDNEKERSLERDELGALRHEARIQKAAIAGLTQANESLRANCAVAERSIETLNDRLEAAKSECMQAKTDLAKAQLRLKRRSRR